MLCCEHIRADENKSQMILTISILCSLLVTTNAFSPVGGAPRAATAMQRLRGGTPVAAEEAIAIVVDAEIEPSRVEEFLKVMEADCKGSREEPGCLRFDVIRDMSNPNRFFFYEAYVSAAAVDEHKAQPHFKLWSDFKESGGVVKSVSSKASVVGEWGFQGGVSKGRKVAF